MSFLFFTLINLIFLLLARGVVLPIPLLLLDYFLIFLVLKNKDPLSPLYWFFFIWNFLFANTLSGIITYTLPDEAYFYSFIVFALLCVFYLGYIVAQTSFKSVLFNRVICTAFFETPFVLKIAKYSAISCIFAALFLIIDVVVINRLDFLNPLELRNYVNNKTSGTIFAQLASILFFGGLFSLITYPYLKKYRLLVLISIFCYFIGSVLSAGRQQIFQIALLSFVLLIVNKIYKVKTVFSKAEKILFICIGVLFISYLVLITTKRNFANNDSDVNEFVYTFYEANNSIEYSSDFKWLVNKLPSGLQSVLIEMSFYFSHELVGLYERSQNSDYSLVETKLLRLFPFVERQVDKIYVFGGESQIDRYSNGRKSSYKGYIDQTAWATIIYSSLMLCGFLGTIVFIFFHGYLSYILYYNCKLMKNVLSYYANIANILFILYTIMYSLFAETPYFILILVLILLFCFKRYKSRHTLTF